jgi:hypothetical protein
MFYVLNEEGVVVRTATFIANMEALRSAGYTIVESELNMDIERAEVRNFPMKPVIAERATPVLPRIVLTTTARDDDGDGVSEIPADGKSKAALRVTLQDVKGIALKKSVEVSFRVTAGSISQRTVKTEGGKATVQLTASQETVTAVIYAFAEGFTPASLTLEFVPK